MALLKHDWPARGRGGHETQRLFSRFQKQQPCARNSSGERPLHPRKRTSPKTVAMSA